MTDEEFDEQLRRALIANLEKELAQLPSDEELRETYTFSARHNARMEKLFRRVRHRDRARAAARYARTAATAAAVAAALSFALLLTSQPVRAAVASAVTRWFDGFTKFFVGDMGDEIGADISPDIWRPKHLPADFAEQETIVVGDITHTVYASASGDSMTMIYSADSSTAVNNDGIQYDTVTIGGVEYHIFMSTDGISDNAVVWRREGALFELYSQVPTDTLMAVAQSVEKQPQ
ncbi:MAG: DUF4367 domain-containing protein [Oscillospiraceae bacterium]|nr:DUF4367 domain-containing protein [Oscillospiraceae bacterium]